jgi:hypothetical protein
LDACDPLLLTFDPQTGNIRIDDLVSGPWLEGAPLPDEMSAAERQWVQGYRKHRIQWQGQHVKWKRGLSPAEADWFDFASWLVYLAAHLDPDSATPIGRHWREAAGGLLDTLAAGEPVTAWRAAWFDRQPQSLGETSNVPSDGGPVPVKGPEVVPNPGRSALAKHPADSSRGPHTVANRNLAKRASERRRIWTTAAAVSLPLPIFLVGFLLLYFLWPDSGRPRDVANHDQGGELPTVQLPSRDMNVTGLADIPQPASPNDTVPPTGDRFESDEVDVADDMATATDSAAAADLADLSQSVADADEETFSQPSAKATAAEERMNGVPTELPTMDINPGRMGADEVTTAQDARPLDPRVKSDIAADWPSLSDFDWDGPFVEYLHLISAVDVVGLWGELSTAAETPTSFPVAVSLGKLNRVTAERTGLQLKSVSPAAAVTWVARRQIVVQPPIVQAWEIVDSAQSDPRPVATVQALSDGDLQMLLWPTTPEVLQQMTNLRVELSYREQLYHEIALVGEEPAVVPAGWQAAMSGSGETARSEAGQSADSEELPSKPLGEGDGTPAAATLTDLAFDLRTAVAKTWVAETPDLKDVSVEWRFQLAGKPLRPLDKDNYLWQNLKVRGKEQPYILDERFDTGSIVFTAVTEAGAKTRLQARLQFLTPNGLQPLKKGAAAEASAQALQFQQALQLQSEQRRANRAKPGEGDLKQAELSRLEAMIREIDRYRGALQFAIDQDATLLEQGVAFELVRVGVGESPATVVLRSPGYLDTMGGEEAEK